MAKTPPKSLVSYFDALPDPREDRTKKHALTDILVISLANTRSGGESFNAVHRFAIEQKAWLKRFCR